jgi:ATP-binding cassette subfamily B multidrug efflux pump
MDRGDPRQGLFGDPGAAVSHYLWEMRPYFRQVAGQFVLGSLCGIVMNTAIVLPALLLGRAIDTALAYSRGEADAAALSWAIVLFMGGTLLTEGPRVLKRWWLMTGNARIRANVRADAFRGVIAWPMERLHRTPIGDGMARIVGDVEVLGVGVREFSIEIWDTVLFSISLIVAMVVIDPGLSLLTLLPVPLAIVIGQAAGRWVGQRTTAAREANAELTGSLQEQLVGVRVLRLFARGDAATAQIARLARQQADRNLAVSRLRDGLQPVYTTLMSAGILFLMWQGAERVVARSSPISIYSCASPIAASGSRS